MSFFNRLRARRGEPVPAQGFQVLTFGPAIVWISVADKDATGELDALAAAVEKLGSPHGFSTERVFAAASEMARLIKIDGVGGIVDRMKTELGPEAKADAMRLALVAALTSPLGDSSDIGILTGIGEHIGLSKAAFEALLEAAKTLA